MHSPTGEHSTSQSAERAWQLRSSDPGTAVDLARQASRAPEAQVRARAQAALGYGLLRLVGPDPALEALRDADRQAQACGDPVAVARTHTAAGAVALVQGQHSDAVGRFQQAVTAFGQAGDLAGQVGARMNLALVHRHLGDHPAALELLVWASELFHDLDDGYGEAVALANIGATYRDLDDNLAAQAPLEHGWEIARGLDRPGLALFIQASLGAVVGANGDPARARELLQDAITRADDLGAPQVQCEALGNLAALEAPRSQQRARELLDRALGLVRATGDVLSVSKALLVLADSCETPEQAGAAYEEACALADRSEDPAIAVRAHRGAAEACEQLGQTDGALTHWRASLQAADQLAQRRREQRLAQVQVAVAVREARADVQRSRRRIAELTTAARMHQDLIAMIAHELRNPLTVAQMATGLLDVLSSDPQVHELKQRLSTSHGRITHILDAVVADAAAEQGELVLERRREDLGALVSAIVDEHRDAAGRKDQTLVLRASSIPAQIDADRLFHAIDNLLSNGIKYSPRGSTVQVQLHDLGRSARIEVIDQGPGVTAADAPRLFEPFTRGAASPTGGERSTGLGLHIVRRMVLAHGGAVGVEPNPDGPGSCFWIQVPLTG